MSKYLSWVFGFGMVSILAFSVGLSLTARAGADDYAFTGYAWSSNIGWISLSCTNEAPPTCDTQPDYQVMVNFVTGDVSGYAWSSNIGWIDFSPAGPYPEPHNIPATLSAVPPSECSSLRGFRGWARALSYGSGWDGWIKLSGDTTAGTHYGVCVTATGDALTGWAWGGGTASNLVGWIQFDPAYSFLIKESKLIEIRPR